MDATFWVGVFFLVFAVFAVLWVAMGNDGDEMNELRAEIAELNQKLQVDKSDASESDQMTGARSATGEIKSLSAKRSRVSAFGRDIGVEGKGNTTDVML